jgi:hypothetical protein
VSTERSPLAGSTTTTRACRGSSNAPGTKYAAMMLPSEDQDGRAYAPSVAVNRCGSPPDDGTRYTSDVVERSQSSWRADTKAIREPSGDQVGSRSSKSPDVSCVGPSPSPMPTIHT